MDTTPSLEQWAGQANPELGLVFADIVGSTNTVYQLGTRPYSLLRDMCLQTAERLLGDTDGRLVDKTGDGFFCVFRSPVSAYRFADAFFRDRETREVLQLRLGLHYGPVTPSGNELLGRNVHYGARVMQHGHGAEFWVSDAAKEAIGIESPEGAKTLIWLQIDRIELRGIPGVQRLWRVA